MPSGAAPGAQVVDPANDANGGSYWAGDPDTATPAGSQPYADVTSVLFKTTKRVDARRRATVTGFTVTMTLTAAPVPPAGTAAVYRVLGFAPGCVFGVDYYTSAPADGQPQSAFQDWCTSPIRRTAIAAPVVRGTTITWAVPLSAVPRDTKIRVGSTLTDLHFEVLATQTPACTGARGEEQAPCAVMLDSTFRRTGTYTVGR